MNIHIAERADTVIWDFDNTILKTFDILYGLMSIVLMRRGMHVPGKDHFAQHFHGPLDSSIRGIVGEGVGRRDLEGIRREFIELDNDYIQNVDDHMYDDAVNLITRIHDAGGRTQLVVTDREHGIDRRNGSPRNLIRDSRVGHMITEVICRDDHGYSKPDIRVLGQRRSKIEHAQVIGDQVVDVELAKLLGGTALLVRRNDLPMAHMDQLRRLSDITSVVSSLEEVGVQPRPLPLIPRHRPPVFDQAEQMGVTYL